MNLLKYIPLHLLLYLILGISIGFVFSPRIDYTLAIVFVLISVLCLLSWNFKITLLDIRLYTVISALIFVGIGVISVYLDNDFNDSNHYSNHLKAENNAKIRVVERKKSNPIFHNYIGKIETLNGKVVKGKVKLNVPLKFPKPIALGEVISSKITFKLIKKPLNPFAFNYQNFMLNQQIIHQVYLDRTMNVQINSRSSWDQTFKARINQQLIKFGFKDDELNIMNALLLGQRSNISAEMIANYQKAGAIHILAISGLHIGIILLMLNFLLRPLLVFKNGKLMRLSLVIILLWSFAFLAGFSASVIRATAMFTAIAIGFMNGKKISTYKALIISMFFLLIINPRYLLNVGFQLSYLAVFFIVWAQPLLAKLWVPRLRLLNYPWQLFTVSLAAQIGVLPLSLYYFHQFPGLFFLSNLVIIPFLGIILALGFLIIVLSLINTLPHFLQKGYEFLIQSLNQFITWIGKQESFIFENISFSLVSLILLYLLIIMLFVWMSKKSFKRLLLLLFAIILFQSHLLFYQLGRQKDQWVVFNKSKETVIGILEQQKLFVYSSMEGKIETSSMINSFLMGNNALLSKSLPLKNALLINDTPILIIDQLMLIPDQKMEDPVIILRASTRINLDRFIQSYRPNIIIADASNYASLIPLWEKTCEYYNIKFHYTVRDGAFLGQL